MAETENKFPTINDLIAGLTKLAEIGLGELPIQVLVAPDSTMQAIARQIAGPDYDGRPALMIDLTATAETGRIAAAIMSADRMPGGGTAPH